MVRDLSNTVFRRWPTPAISPEGKIDFMDDLAVVYVDFGPGTLMTAMDEIRQAEKFRPKIADIRERCNMVKAKSSGNRQNHHQADLNEYHARLRSHPEEFLPISLIVRDFNQLRRLELEHRDKGIAIDPQDRQNWIEWRERETEKEWAKMLEDGRASRLANQAPSQERSSTVATPRPLF